MSYHPTEFTTDVLEEIREYYKAELGRFDIEGCYTDNHFDKKKFGRQCRCSYCNKAFNPFKVETLKAQNQWSWADENLEPQKDFCVSCPKCDRELRFTIFIGQA